MTQATFTNWTQINRASGVDIMRAEDTVLATVDSTRLAEILAEDGGLIQIEGVTFTPGGDFVKALTGSGQVVETSVELVS